MSLTATYAASLSGTQVNALDLGTNTFPFSSALSGRFTSGVGSGMVDLLFSDSRTLSASATEDLDLAGSLVDAMGATLTFVKLKAILIKASSANTNNVVLSRPASNGVPLFAAASDAISIMPGGCFLWVAPVAGVTVTAATGDLITLTNSAGGTGVTFEIVIMGTSA
jgi:hypothetical protein